MSEVVVKILAKNLTKRGVQDAEKTIGRLRKAVDQMAFRMKVAGAAMTGIGFMAVREFANFDRKVREIGTLLGGLTQEQIKTMGDEIRKTAIEFGQAFDTMAKARYDIVSAGFTDAADSAILLRESAKLAVAGVAEVSETADVLTSALNAYGKSAEDAAHFSDVLFSTVRLGKTTISELASGLGRVISVAPQAGVSFEELSAAIATLTSIGQSTEEVVTALNAAFLAFINTSPAMERRLADLGFETGVAAIKSLGFAEALKAVTENASIVEIQEMFGNIRAFRAVAPLAGRAAEKFAYSLKQVAQSSGETQQALEQMIDSPAMRLARLQQRWKSAMIDIGEALEPIVTGLEKVATEFSKLDTLSKTIILSFSGFVALLKFVSPIIMAFGSSLGKVLLTLGKFGGPVAIAVGAIAVLVNAFKDAQRETDTFVEKQKELTRLWQANVPDLVQEMQRLQTELKNTDDVAKRMELGSRIAELQEIITQRLNETADTAKALSEEVFLNIDLAPKKEATKEALDQTIDLYEEFSETISQMQQDLDEQYIRDRARVAELEAKVEYDRAVSLMSLRQQMVDKAIEMDQFWINQMQQNLQQATSNYFRESTFSWTNFSRNVANRLSWTIGAWATERVKEFWDRWMVNTRNDFAKLMAGIGQAFTSTLIQMASKVAAIKFLSFIPGVGPILSELAALSLAGGSSQIPAYAQAGFSPRGTDVVPAMLTRGEAVVPREVVRRQPELVQQVVTGTTTQPQPTTVTLAPSFNIQAIDAQGVRDFLNSFEFRNSLAEMVNDLRLRLKAGKEIVMAEF